MANRKLITVIIPCYNEAENIDRTYRAVKGVLTPLSAYDHELIFVDNGSEDTSAELMRRLAAADPTVTAILLSRNFGPESSWLAGLRQARGDAIVTLPADLQDPPELIPELVKHFEAGYDLVLGQVTTADENRLMLVVRRLFYAVLKKLAYVDMPTGVTGFGLISARVCRAICQLPEKDRFGRGLFAWAGFKRVLIPYQKVRRQYGRSSYNFFDYLKHAEKGLFGFSTLPLDFITYLGIFLVVLAVLLSVTYLFWVVAFGNPIKGSATLLLAIMLFGGTQVLAVSVVGKYIGIIFEETKRRPHYLIREIISSRATGAAELERHPPEVR